MAFSAKILKDSVSSVGVRLTTVEVTFPRIILAEFNTHRVFSRNSASSRAIPVEKRIQAVLDDPFVPEAFGKNQKGMQASEDLTGDADKLAREAWLIACGQAVQSARRLSGLDGVIPGGVHKQLANRVLEPWLWQTVIVSSTEWDNFYALRCHPDAQPEIKKIAIMMRDAQQASTPVIVNAGEWHLPLVEDKQELISSGFSIEDIKKISIGRCARVSYLTHDGKRDPYADIVLCDRLLKSGHLSPFEHVAIPMSLEASPHCAIAFYANFRGWVQARKEITNESNFKNKLAETAR